jgi:hypothetical protein
MTTTGTGPYTADIGDGQETFETLADIQRAMRARVSGIRSSSEWYRQMRSRHGAKVRDAAGKVVATVSYNARLWRPSGAMEEILVVSRAHRSCPPCEIHETQLSRAGAGSRSVRPHDESSVGPHDPS